MTDQPFTPTLADHLALETEDARIEHAQQQLDVELETSGIRRVVALLDGEMMQRAVTLSPTHLAHMDVFQKRQLADWIERRVRLLDEKASLLAHNIGREQEPPECWRMAHAGNSAAECA